MKYVHCFRGRIYNLIAMASHRGNPFLPSTSCVRIQQCGAALYILRHSTVSRTCSGLAQLTLEVCGYR